MRRSAFLRSITGFLGLAVLPPLTAIKQYQRFYLLQSFVRGFRYYNGPNLLANMQEDDMLELRREPLNKHDNCAIALFYNEEKIGYLPREDNEILSKLMDADVVMLQAEITHLNKDAKAWENVHVAVFVLKELQGEIPATATYLTVLETPHYRTVKTGKDTVTTVYYTENEKEDFLMSADEFYGEMVANSKNDGIYDILHSDFGSPEIIDSAIAEGRIIVNMDKLPKDLKRDDLVKAIDDEMIVLNKTFDKKGFVVANVNRVAKLSGRIESVVGVMDKLDRKYFEVNFL